MADKLHLSLIKTAPPGPATRRLVARERVLFPDGAYKVSQ